MCDPDRPRPAKPPTPSETSTRPGTELLSALGAYVVRSGRSQAAWMEQWGSAFLSLVKAVESVALWLHPWCQVLHDIGQSPEVQRLGQGLAALVQLGEVAPTYCTPYQRELRRLGLPPLTKDNELCVMMATALLRDRRGAQPGMEATQRRLLAIRQAPSPRGWSDILAK